MNNERCLYSAYSLLLEKKNKTRAQEQRCGQRYGNGLCVPGAPDKDVLVFSVDRARVAALICEPGRGGWLP